MIDVKQAKALISLHSGRLSHTTRLISDASNHILASDIQAICDIPSFDQSSMDGYAIRFEDRSLALEIIGEMAAGARRPIEIHPAQAVRIFTGAPLPSGADTVVMQEHIRIDKEKLIIVDSNLSHGMNVRAIGSEIKAGSVAMQQGDVLSAAASGFLAGLGITEVDVYPMPAVSVILTGNELVQPGESLKFGQVYESNSYALKAALNLAGITQVRILRVSDDLDQLANLLRKALEESDVVLLTGGVSVGDYDFVIRASEVCGLETIFHKVKQKPGKPLFFAKKDNKLVFGLPGNPASVLSCFYNYVLPALSALSGRSNPVGQVTGVLAHNYTKISGLTYFLKGRYEDGRVSALDAQESFRLSSFAKANCLIILEEGHNSYQEGEEVGVLLLP